MTTAHNRTGIEDIPRFIYGTAWKEAATTSLVKGALARGFTGIDTANQRKHYHEAAVGAALTASHQAGVITRAALFLQTKFTYAQHQGSDLPYDPATDYATQVNQSFQSSLNHLQTDYLDAYLLHAPYHNEGLTEADWTVWHAITALHRAGHIQQIGVSNVTLAQLKALYQQAEVKPTIVQNRYFARLGWDQQVRAYCRQQAIHYQGFSLLTANAEVISHGTCQAIATRTGLTPAQVILQAALRMGMQVLTGTTNAQHQQEVLQCERVLLTEADWQQLETLLIGTVA